jgi:RNA polymerase sigma factor (sigma-70 family)
MSIFNKFSKWFTGFFSMRPVVAYEAFPLTKPKRPRGKMKAPNTALDLPPKEPKKKYVHKAKMMTYYGGRHTTDSVPPMIHLTKQEEADAWRKRRRSAKARNLLTRRYLCFAFKAASRFTGPRLAHDDAISAANAGMMEAMERFKPEGGAHFTTFCTLFIRRHLINALVDSYCIRVSDHVRKKFAAALKSKKKIVFKDGEPGSIEELFARLSTSTDVDISQMTTKAPDAPATPFEASNPAQDAEESSLPDELKEGISTLEPIERKVIKARYYTFPPESFDALGVRLGKTKIFLREVHDEALVKLRKYMQDTE